MLRLLHRVPGSQQCLINTPRFRTRFRAPGPFLRHEVRQRRGFANTPTVLLPPVVFGGLVIALWTWKCLMMVIFQNKIIYMPGLPPNARRERIEDYKNQCGGIEWKEERIKSLDGTRISLCVATVDRVLFGNASSLPPRLPFLSPVLRMLGKDPLSASTRYIMVCCSYRGYWTSRGRPSEKGIAMDAAAALNWIKDDSQAKNSDPSEPVPIIIWGQSIGAGVASNLAASPIPSNLSLKALILETPFLSIRTMLETLYPQKWLPYRYLWPFLRNHLDSWKALGLMKQRLGVKTPHVLVLEAGKDELVPSSHGEMLERRCRELDINVEKKVVGNALHTEVMVRQEGVLTVVETIRDVAQTVHKSYEQATSPDD